MKLNNVSNWFQIAASAGVFAGLILVAYELNQAKALSHANFAVQGITEDKQHMLTLLGENPATALTKACLYPEKLDDEDFIILDAHYWSWLLSNSQIKQVGKLGDYEISQTIDATTATNLGRVASTDVGRQWLSVNAHKLSPLSQEILKSVLSKPVDCGSETREFISRVREKHNT